MQAAENPFKDYWASTVHPAIKDDFERLLKTTPKRIASKHKQKAEKEKKEKDKGQEAATAPHQKTEKQKAEKDPVHEKITLVVKRCRRRASAGMPI